MKPTPQQVGCHLDELMLTQCSYGLILCEKYTFGDHLFHAIEFLGNLRLSIFKIGLE